ncbi:MAG TPA: hypothetical protein VG797_11950 [Phycisphaerales bacterium]|nr:hypothetical protein [Phycisphaerales bacterium]
MKRCVLRSLLCALGGFAVLASSASAQFIPGAFLFGWKYNQPYVAPRGAVESRIMFCQNPQIPQNGRVAADDWICTRSGPIVRISWNGVVLTPAQLQGNRRYRIAFYRDANCCPGEQICNVCVVPSIKPVSMDCQQRRVYEFTAPLPTACFSQVAGTHYWVEIAEEDETSARFGLPDFMWSSHVSIKNCPAKGRQAGAACFNLFDDCFDQPTDLAFRLGSRMIIVISNPGHPLPAPSGPPVGVGVSILDPGTGNPVWNEPVNPCQDGTIIIDPDLPDGNFTLELAYPHGTRARMPIQLLDGQVTQVDSFFDVFYGDLDDSGAVGLGDIARILANWGRSTAVSAPGGGGGTTGPGGGGGGTTSVE